MDIQKLKERWQTLYRSLVGAGGDLDRDLVITPYFGHYGLAGYVIAIQGSPTHGLAVLELDRARLICIGPSKITYTNHPYGRPASKSKQALYDTTLDLLKAMGLPLSTGGVDNLDVYYIKSGTQEIPEE